MQFMSIKEFYNREIGRKVFFVAIVFAFVVFLLSAMIYLNKAEKSIKKDYVTLNNLEQKINQSIKLKKTIESITLPEGKNSEIFLAQFIDDLKLKFPEVNVEVSKMKKEDRQLTLDMTLKSETSWSRFSELINFLEGTNYPFIFLKSIMLSKKDKAIAIELKSELRLIYQENDKGI